MMSVRGKIQREDAVVHLVAHHLTNLSEELASVGERDGSFPLPHGRGDQVRDGGSFSPDQRDLPPRTHRVRDIYIPDLHIDAIKVTTGLSLSGAEKRERAIFRPIRSPLRRVALIVSHNRGQSPSAELVGLRARCNHE
jgi:hypothetical protein